MSFKLINRKCDIHHHNRFVPHALRAASLVAQYSHYLHSALIKRWGASVLNAQAAFNNSSTCLITRWPAAASIVALQWTARNLIADTALNFSLLFVCPAASIQGRLLSNKSPYKYTVQSNARANSTSRLIYYDSAAIVAVVLAMFATFRRLLSTSSCRRFILLALRASIWSSHRSAVLSRLCLYALACILRRLTDCAALTACWHTV